MSDFVKWPSAENSYREKFITMFLDHFPELATRRYIVSEKIHGSCWQWVLTPNKPIRAGSRNNFLDMSGSFQGAVIQELYEAHEQLLRLLQSWADFSSNTVHLFGELHGRGIQKGVDYGEGKKVLYFGMMNNGELLPFQKLQEMVDTEHLVPVVGRVDTLQEALDFESEFPSHVSPTGDICEGVVIMPLHNVYQIGHSSFILKKKNEAFLEVSNAKKEIVIDEVAAHFGTEFRRYITVNRLQSVFSKEGEISEPGQMGLYIKAMLADAKEDFAKDYDIEHLSKKQQKAVFNVGGIIANMLKEYL